MNSRIETYDGYIHKCPNCGETLESFKSKCPTCGFELRSLSASSSATRLSQKLTELDMNRKEHGLITASFSDALGVVDKTSQAKISLIRNFVIPNSREDILEFMILARSNVSEDDFSIKSFSDEVAKRTRKAWLAKAEQAYQKAKVSFDEKDLVQIREIYDDIKLANKKLMKKMIIMIVGLFAAVIFLVIFTLIMSQLTKQQ